MDSPQGSLPISQDAPSLPPGFITLDQVLNLPNEKIMYGRNKNVPTVNVIGFLKDFQPPRMTAGTDWKCTLEIKDFSLPGSNGMKVNIFWSESRMPKLPLGAGDAILIRKAKPQMNRGLVDLIASKWSEFHIIPASNLPTVASAYGPNLWQSFPPTNCSRPVPAETAYFIKVNGNTEALELPTALEFEQRIQQAKRVKEKFSLLKDVEADQFYDILVQVIRLYDEGNPSTLYVSDYTANSKFYEYVFGEKAPSGRDGDEHNYLKSREKAAEKQWPGPFGKMAIQMTLWDAQAAFVREEVKVGDWVSLRNVQVKCSKTGGLLEGVLRNDRDSFEGKVQVEIMEQPEEPDQTDEKWKAAVARKFEYEKKFKLQKQKLQDEEAGLKRKRNNEPSKPNAKQRRKEKRAALDAKATAQKTKAHDKLDLNVNIRTSNPDEVAVPITEILKVSKNLTQKKDDRGALSPFNICKYKANVRVVDYFPANIEDFAVGRRESEYDLLSDYSGGEDTDAEEDMRSFRNGKGFPRKNWEWRFALQVVDANPKSSKERMWLVVSNADAQMLFDLDAADLRREPDLLQKLKEQMFILWGNLEEQKSALQAAAVPKEEAPYSKKQKLSPVRKPGVQPPMDSDDEDEDQQRREPRSVNPNVLSERSPNARIKLPPSEQDKQPSFTGLQVKNKAFTCCIKQYGVKVNEDNPALANAGEGKRWERRFGMFGTQIA